MTQDAGSNRHRPAGGCGHPRPPTILAPARASWSSALMPRRCAQNHLRRVSIRRCAARYPSPRADRDDFATARYRRCSAEQGSALTWPRTVQASFCCTAGVLRAPTGRFHNHEIFANLHHQLGKLMVYVQLHLRPSMYHRQNSNSPPARSAHSTARASSMGT